jgi:hypothetical protein
MRKLKAVVVALAAVASVLLPSGAGAATTVWNATQVDGVPNTFYWAVIAGATDYAGSTPNATGSAEDAYALRDHLLSLGWRSDHIFMLTNLSMTRDNLLRSIRWLASKTNSRSLAIFHYSGHERPFKTTADGDSEASDVALWGADNRFILDGELGRELGRVRAYKSWIHLSSCRAGGFSDAGTSAPNRVITYSSPQSELSWADSGLKHSVFNYFMIVQGMRNKVADKNRDGKVSVEEAFWYSRNPVATSTGGRQHPVMNDRFYGDFFIQPPK